MARISTYVIDGTIVDGDKVIGSDANNDMITKNYTVGDLTAYMAVSIGSNFLVPYVGATQNVNLGVYDLSAGALSISENFIADGTAGLTGQVLISQGSGSPAIWGYNIGSQDLNSVLNIGNVGSKNIQLTTVLGGALIDVEKTYGNIAVYLTDNIDGTNSFWKTSAIHIEDTSFGVDFLPNKIRYTLGGNYVDIIPNNYNNQTFLLPVYGGYFPMSVNGVYADASGSIIIPIGVGSVTNVTATAPLLSTGGATPDISIPQASTSVDGYLSSTDWNTFDGKQDPITLTTTGTSGAATFVANTLNIPQYSGGGSQNLQQVTDIGNTTTNDIYLNKLYLYDSANIGYNRIESGDQSIAFYNGLTANEIVQFEEGLMTYFNGPSITAGFDFTNLTVGRYYYLPNAAGTFALSVNGNFADAAGDITIIAGSQDLQQVTDIGNTTTNSIEVDFLQTNGDVLAGKLGAGGAVVIDDGGGFAGRIEATNLTTSPTLQLPDATGTFALSVNGIAAGTNGDITVAVPTKTSELFNDGDNGYTHFISLQDLPSNLTLYATNVASGISTYTKAVSSLTDPDFNTVAVDIPIGPLTSTTVATYCGGIISPANIIVGNPGIFTMSTIGNIRRTAGTAEGVFFYEVYKRDSGGTETLIVTSANTFPVSSPIYVEFNAAALFNNGVFTATDRVVIKFYGLRLPGGSNPSFEFQFGGASPVRTTLPIPLVVTPANGVTSVAALTLGTTGTDLSSTVANGTTTPVITLNVPTASATNRGALSSADWTTFNNKQDLSLSSYTVRANNTAVTANATDFPFHSATDAAYGGTVSFTGTTAPSGTATLRYTWNQIGNLVTFRFDFLYTTASAGLNSIFWDFPSDMPQPTFNASFTTQPTPYICNGGTALNVGVATTNRNSTIARNVANTAWIFQQTFTGLTVRYFNMYGFYLTN